MTDQEAELLILRAYEDFADHQRFAEESLSLRGKSGELIPYRFAPSQAKFYESIADQERRGVPIRQVWLKARQVFGSTTVAGYFFQKLAFHEGRHARVIAHEVSASGDIFSYYKDFDKHYQPFRGLIAKSALVADSQNQITWANDSWARILTAANVKTARSARVSYFHASEMAFWPNATQLWRGMIGSCPDTPDTAIIAESTANGLGNEFCDLWEMASAGNSIWNAVFFAWWEHPEYLRTFAAPEEKRRFADSLDKTERQLIETLNLTLEALNWRRHRLAEFQGDIDGFRQEFPSTPEEAFLVSGRPRFSIVDLAAMPVVREPQRGKLEERMQGPRLELSFIVDDYGALNIFRKPEQGHSYAIGADTAQGLDANEGKGSQDPDYSAAAVFDVDTGDQVAAFRDRIEPAEFARLVCTLGAYYNWAFLVPETNGNGIATIQKILELQYPGLLIYQAEPSPDEIAANRSVNRYGWKTTVVTRPQMLSLLDDAIRTRAIAIRDPQTLMECRTFVVKPSGKAEATAGKHDDTVIAIALATVGIQSFPDAARSGWRAGPVKYGRQSGEPVHGMKPPRL